MLSPKIDPSGILNTYWLVHANREERKEDSQSSVSERGSESHGSSEAEVVGGSLLQRRMVDWVVEVLQQYVRQVLAWRRSKAKSKYAASGGGNTFSFIKEGSKLDEVAEVIILPEFDANAAKMASDFRKVKIDQVVTEQLRKYVSVIASMYHNNPFHNFQHACHVTMAVNKFLQRIVAPDLDLDAIEKARNNHGDFVSQLHHYTHGIKDPLTLLAIVFSALIHDVDHRGISNVQLAKEDEQMASMYENKSIAEQNSLDLAWELLSSSEFVELRACLSADESELRHFRQVMVNVVLATDIFDKELNDLRKARWAKAFQEASPITEDAGINMNQLRATIVIEHIIQASDVAHTMQHWHVYRKWNRHLFHELSKAFREGRMGADPAGFWYKGKLFWGKGCLRLSFYIVSKNFTISVDDSVFCKQASSAFLTITLSR